MAQIGLNVPSGPLADASLHVSLMLAGAGAGIAFAAWDGLQDKRATEQAREEARRACAQRDVAILQARRARAQAEGLALMREIHRSTAMPQRQERLHRILTLLADLFEAREVSLFAATAENSTHVQPAACLRITSREEVFVVFDTEELSRNWPASDAAQKAGARMAPLRVSRGSAAIAREGCHLFVQGTLECAGAAVGKAQWRHGANWQAAPDGSTEQDPLATQDPAELLENALSKLDYSLAACLLARQALDCGRTVRSEDRWAGRPSPESTRKLILCVPLIADQKPVGVLRVRRSAEGFDGPEAEAIEELLLESAKHIALALKKDEDDRKAITDALTSLYIKRHFLEKLEQLRAAIERPSGDSHSGNTFCLVMSDIDHFKKVNDTHGHLSGDFILKGVAGILRRGLRSGDMAFRYGGEEMALLLPGSSLEVAEQTAERMRQAIECASLKGDKGQIVPVTVSLGVARFQAGMSGEDLIARADRALYASKQGGRNRTSLWSAAMENSRDQSPNARESSKLRNEKP